MVPPSGKPQLVRIIMNPDLKGYTSKLSENVKSLSDVVEVTFCETIYPEWRLAVYDVRFPWLKGYEVLCHPESHGTVAFDLIRADNESMLFLQNTPGYSGSTR